MSGMAKTPGFPEIHHLITTHRRHQSLENRCAMNSLATMAPNLQHRIQEISHSLRMANSRNLFKLSHGQQN